MSPDHSVDIFEFTFLGTKPIMMYDDVELKKLYIIAPLQIKKQWAKSDGTYESKTWKTWRALVIDFDNNQVLIDSFPADEFSDPPYPPEEPAVDPSKPWTYDWDIEGKIINADYTPLTP